MLDEHQAAGHVEEDEPEEGYAEREAARRPTPVCCGRKARPHSQGSETVRCQRCPQPTGCGDKCRWMGFQDLTHASEVDLDDLEVQEMQDDLADAKAFLDEEEDW